MNWYTLFTNLRLEEWLRYFFSLSFPSSVLQHVIENDHSSHFSILLEPLNMYSHVTIDYWFLLASYVFSFHSLPSTLLLFYWLFLFSFLLLPVRSTFPLTPLSFVLSSFLVLQGDRHCFFLHSICLIARSSVYWIMDKIPLGPTIYRCGCSGWCCRPRREEPWTKVGSK